MFKKKIFFSIKEYISLENIDSKMVKNTVQNRRSSRRSYSVTYSGTFQARCRWKSILPVAWFRIFSRRLTINRSLVVRALWNRNRSVRLFLNIGRPKGNEPANTANGFVAHRIRIQDDSSDLLFPSPSLEYLDIGLFPLEKFYADRWILFIQYSLFLSLFLKILKNWISQEIQATVIFIIYHIYRILIWIFQNLNFEIYNFCLNSIYISIL